MTINLLEELERRDDYDVAFFMTYTLNLQFFESLILPRLRRLNVTSIGILADRKGYEDSLDDPLGQQECGHSYILDAADLPGDAIQHAKLLWLQGRTTVAYVGSHNLTGAGYNDQLEFTTRLESTDPGHVLALRQIHETVSRVVRGPLERVWRRATAPAESVEAPSARFLSSIGGPLLDQLFEEVGATERVRVVTPYLDAPTLSAVASRFGAASVTLDVPAATAGGADTPIAEAAAAVSGLVAREHGGSSGRRLHAKAFEFRSGERSVLAVGSANCTRAAMERTLGPGGNLEFLLLVDDAVIPDHASATFEPIDDLSSFPYTGRDWNEGRHAASPVRIVRAEYEDGTLEVEWACTAPYDLSEFTLLIDDEPFAVTSSPVVMHLDASAVPRTAAMLLATRDEHATARAWIVRWDQIASMEQQRWRNRWIQTIEASNPTVLAEGIELWLNLLRDEVEVPEVERPGRLSLGQTTERPAIDPLVEVFEFSRDSNAVRAAAVRLLGPDQFDPLALLRALLARYAVPAPASEDTDDSDSHSSRHEVLEPRAARLLASRIANYMRWLSESLADATRLDPNKATAFWSLTFFAVGEIWYRACARSAEVVSMTLRDSVVDAFVELVAAARAEESLQDTLNHDGVKQSLMFGFAAMSDVAEPDRTQSDRLARLARRALGSQPTLGGRLTASDSSKLKHLDPRTFARAESDLARLLGFAEPRVGRLIAKRWQLLRDLQDADMGLGGDRRELFAAAQAAYGEAPLWTAYLQARKANQLPVVLEASADFCPNCRIVFPTQKRAALRKGDAVLCDRGHIVILRT